MQSDFSFSTNTNGGNHGDSGGSVNCVTARNNARTFMTIAPPFRLGAGGGGGGGGDDDGDKNDVFDCRTVHNQPSNPAAEAATTAVSASSASSGAASDMTRRQRNNFTLPLSKFKLSSRPSPPPPPPPQPPSSLSPPQSGLQDALYDDFMTRSQHQCVLEADRRVRFDERLNREREHISRLDMTDDEMLDCWYDEYDLEDMQLDAVDTVRAIRRMRKETIGSAPGSRTSALAAAEEEAEEQRGICSRGLEHVINPQILERRKIAKDTALDAVLTEQEALIILWEESRRCVPNADEVIAEASRSVTREAAEAAVRMGLKDAAVARHIARIDWGGRRRLDQILRQAFAM